MSKCEYCGKEFKPSHRSQKYCSLACSGMAHRGGGTRGEKSRKRRTRICETCGKEFVMHSMSGKGNRGEVNEGRFCSRRCAGVWRHSKRTIFPSCEVHFITCAICGKLFLSRRGHKRCSKECDSLYRSEYSKAWYLDNKERTRATARDTNIKNWVRPKPFKCKQCGRLHQPEYGDKSKYYCSETCRQRAKRLMKRLSNSEHSRRITERHGESFDAVDVLKRDGWRCQLCGKKLSPNHRGTYRDDAPELDHIIPLAVGGEHSKRNTQCACRRCNLSKGSDVLGQLRLFG